MRKSNPTSPSGLRWSYWKVGRAGVERSAAWHMPFLECLLQVSFVISWGLFQSSETMLTLSFLITHCSGRICFSRELQMRRRSSQKRTAIRAVCNAESTENLSQCVQGGAPMMETRVDGQRPQLISCTQTRSGANAYLINTRIQSHSI